LRVDKVSNIKDNCCAILKGFDRSDIEVTMDEQEARIRSGSVFSKAKVSSIEFRLIELVNRAASNRAFSIAASDAKDNLLKSARCTVKIGHIAPYASLANLVKVLHNLPALSGITDRMRKELTRSAHLVISSFKGCYGEGSIFNSYAP
jgi:hypothetical protein